MTLDIHIHEINVYEVHRKTDQVYVVKEALYQEFSMLEVHQPWNVTHFIPTSFIPMLSTNLYITYMTITMTEMQTTIIGLMISKILWEILQLDIYGMR